MKGICLLSTDEGAMSFLMASKTTRKLLVVFLLKRFDFASKITVCVHQPSQLHEVRMIAILTSTARLLRSALEGMATPCSVKSIGQVATTTTALL